MVNKRLSFCVWIFAFVCNLSAAEDNRHFLAEGELLWWSATVQGLDFAVTHVRSANSFVPFTNAIHKGKIAGVHSSWDTGWRVLGTYHLPFDQWDLKAAWTHFDTHAKETARAQAPEYLAVLWGAATFPTSHEADFAEGKWNLKSNAFDLTLNRAFFVSCKLSLSPYFGVKGAWIDQNFNILYHYSALDLPFLTPFQTIKNRSDFWGVGPNMGATSHWHLGKHWNIYGNFGGALLYGSHRSSYIPQGGTVIFPVKISEHETYSCFTYQIALGLRWATAFRNDKVRLGMHLGWEQNTWMHILQLILDQQPPLATLALPQTEDLTLQGIVAGAELDF